MPATPQQIAEVARASTAIQGYQTAIVGYQVAITQQQQNIVSARGNIQEDRDQLRGADTLPDDQVAALEANITDNLVIIAQNEAAIEQNTDNIAQTQNLIATQQAFISEVESTAQSTLDAATVSANGAVNQNFIDANDPQGPGDNDPFEAARLAAEERANADPADITLTPDEQAAADDPFEARRLELEQEANRAELAEQATEFDPAEAPGENIFDPGQTFNAGEESVFNPAAVDGQDPANATRADQNVIDANDPQGSGDQEAANKWQATQQATLQSRLNQPSSADWRVRLSLGPGSNYLYNAPSAQGKNSTDILAPLFRTNGVIFPYTPTIETSYQAKYQTSDLTHSNYRGYFYQNSYVNDVNVRGVFTAQDTKEAEYLLATIHFFRSVTKMFYGKDAEAGTPPPLVYLSGFGQFQYNNHPCLVTAFNYSLPSDVDYIRANGFNNFGLNLENRRNQSSGPAPGGGLSGVFGAISRLTNSGLSGGSLPQTPSPSNVNQQVNNTNPTNSTYVPTKMEISITLLPVQSRKQISQQFSLKSFASGDLLKGGFW
jgi:hypothetical protein